MAAGQRLYVGPSLRRIRRDRGLTQSDMAADLDVSPSYIALLERNHRPLSAELLLRPTISHPDLTGVLHEGDQHAIHLKLARDGDGRPVDALHVHGYAPREDSRIVEKAIWEQLSFAPSPATAGEALPDTLGEYAPGRRSEPLAIAQLLLLWHLLEART